MLFNDETRHWQDEYRKGNLDGEAIPGEILCILDGTAERMNRTAIWWVLWCLPTTFMMFFFGMFQARNPAKYAAMYEYLQGLLHIGVDPTVLIVLFVAAVSVVLSILIRKARTRRTS